MQTVTVTFEADSTVKQYPAKVVEKIAEYHGGRVGKFTDRTRKTFQVSAPSSALDFDHIASNIR